MEVLRAAGYRRTRWKNGAGSTLEIAAAHDQPPGWRISLAAIDRDAPFSEFAGYDRTLTIVHGSGVLLYFDGGSKATAGTLRPFAFPGERRVLATLLKGPSQAFNVMTQRSQFTHRVELARLDHEVWRGTRPFRSFAYLIGGPHAGDTVEFTPGDPFPPGVDGAPCVAVAIFRAP